MAFFTFLAVTLLSAIILFSFHAHAQDVDVEIEFDQSPDEKVDFTVNEQVTMYINGNITITTYTPTPKTYYIGIYPDDWVVSFTPEEIYVIYQTTEPFEGEIKVPSDSEQKDYTIGIWVSSEKRDFGNELEFTSSSVEGKATFDVFIIQNRVKIEAITHDVPAEPNSTVAHRFRITNIGTTADTFDNDVLNDESLINRGWIFDASAWSLDLEPDQSELVQVDVYIPSEVEGGIYNLQIEASSTQTRSSNSISSNTHVTIPESPLPAPWWLSFWFLSLVGFVAVGAGLAAFFGATEIGYYSILSLILPLYVRIKKKDVLNHFTRGQIYGYIQANPGAHYNAILQDLSMHNGVTAYHLHVLEREGYIKSFRDGMYKRFYPKDMKIPEKKLHLSHIQKSLLHELHRYPGISQKDLAKLLDESKQVVNYHIKILEEVGLIRCERGSRTTALYPANVRYVEHEDTYETTDDKTASTVVRI